MKLELLATPELLTKPKDNSQSIMGTSTFYQEVTNRFKSINLCSFRLPYQEGKTLMPFPVNRSWKGSTSPCLHKCGMCIENARKCLYIGEIFQLIICKIKSTFFFAVSKCPESNFSGPRFVSYSAPPYSTSPPQSCIFMCLITNLISQS